MSNSLPILLWLILVTALPAQVPSFRTFAPECPARSAPLQITGVPRLGGSFSVADIGVPLGCTFRFCGCTPGVCNSCSGALLVIGATRIQAPVPPTGCLLRVSPDVILPGNGQRQLTISVPANPALNGVQFHMVRVRVGAQQVIQANCSVTYPLTGIQGFSNAVTGTIGR